MAQLNDVNQKSEFRSSLKILKIAKYFVQSQKNSKILKFTQTQLSIHPV